MFVLMTSKAMNRILIFLAISMAFATGDALAQKKYTTSGGEVIFSWADARLNGLDVSTITRFSTFFSVQTQFHYDMQEKFGVFTGINVRNVGFIFDDPVIPETRYKVRNYTLGIPFAFKLGEVSRSFFFGGYEIEFPFNYKQKTFVNEEKTDKFDVWFSKRTPTVYHTLFAGFQGPHGAQVKFKYYLTNFFNKSYSAVDANGDITYPYQDFNATVFYVSLSVQILKGTKFYSDTQQARK